MKKLVFILYLCFQCSFSQENLKHQVYFETDKYNIPETEKNRLLVFLSKIENTAIEKISIYGFCDDRGSNTYNLKLSQQRADAIKNVFVNHKFNDTLITNVDGKGEILLNIIHEADALKIRGLNRKVEILIKPKQTSKLKTEIPKKQDTETLLKGELKVGDKILLEHLLFRTGYSYLVKDSKPILDKIAKILVHRNDIYFTIEGHVCCTPGARDALDKRTKKRNLSLARAKFVYDYLEKKGVNRDRMKYVGQRHKFPLGGDPDLDKRVELVITYISKNK